MKAIRHHSCETEKIVDEVRRRNYKIREATLKLKYKTKYPLNMFVLSFTYDEDVNKVYGITGIMGTKWK